MYALVVRPLSITHPDTGVTMPFVKSQCPCWPIKMRGVVYDELYDRLSSYSLCTMNCMIV